MQMTFRQFADSQGVTYEAIRQRVDRAGDELAKHIKKKHGVKYLDEYAQEVLADRAYKMPLAVVSDAQQEEIKKNLSTIGELQAELLNKEREITELHKLIASMSNRVAKVEYLEKLNEKATNENRILSDQMDAQRKELSQTRDELSELKGKASQIEADKEALKGEAEKLNTELSRYKRTIFGLYRRVEE